MANMGFREYARHRGCTLRAVQKAIADGRIKVTTDKKIDSDQADRSWEVRTDPAKQSLLYSAGPDTPPRAEAGTAAGEGAEEDSAPSSSDDEHTTEYREHRATVERIKAERAQLELDQLRGQLIDLDEAKRLAYTAFRTLRDQVLNVPARLRDQCAAEADPFRVEQLIERELVAALEAFDAGRVLTDPEEDDAE